MPLALRSTTFFGEDIGDREFLVDGCDPYGACRNNANCLMHSEWADPHLNLTPRCGSLIVSVSNDPCEVPVEKHGDICAYCRSFEAMCKDHDDALERGLIDQ